MLERSIVEDCRDSEEYRKKLFEEIDDLISKLRPYKDTISEKKEREKKHGKES